MSTQPTSLQQPRTTETHLIHHRSHKLPCILKTDSSENCKSVSTSTPQSSHIQAYIPISPTRYLNSIPLSKTFNDTLSCVIIQCMAWTQRESSLSEIDAAGKAFISRRSSPEEVTNALTTINEWRAAHAFPLNTMQMRLRHKVEEVSRRHPFVSQRIKRLPAVDSKLRRLRNVSLSVMQDIGGCRAVVASNRQVANLANVYRGGRIRHEIERENNYIDKPTADGYRSHHLIYRYYSDKNPAYNGQRIEVQMRSRLQHAWATAVETVDAFTSQSLKSNLGEQDYTRFFCLMGSWLALEEDTPIVPGTPENRRELLSELEHLANELNIIDRLQAFRATVRHLEDANQQYHIINLDLDERTVRITSYNNFGEAASIYNRMEEQYRSQPAKDVLLTSVHGARLKRAYPNYFADTDIFIQELRKCMQEAQDRQLRLPL